MTERTKFEQMVERLTNEDRAGAEELFHEIVVERSREIYKSIIESEDEDDDDDLDEADKAEDDNDDLDEADKAENDDEDLDEMFGVSNMSEEDPAMMGGDATDDMMNDISMDDDPDADPEMDMGADDSNEINDEDPLTVLDNMGDALEKLRVEFEDILSGANTDSEESDDDSDGPEEEEEEEAEGNPFADEEEDEKEESFAYESNNGNSPRGKMSAGEQMREYVEKVQGGDLGSKIGGDNGANAKSTVATKNDMGGTSANVLRTDTETPTEANKGQLKGQGLSNGTPKTDNAGNINVPGGKAGKSSFKKNEPGHGAEKKSKPETADKSAGSTIKTTVRKK